MLLDTLGASSLGTGKGTIKASEDTVRADQDFLPPHPLKNFERQRYYEKEPKFNGVYWRNNLPQIKDGAYVINLDEFKPIGTHWTALYDNAENVTYFDSCSWKYSKRN